MATGCPSLLRTIFTFTSLTYPSFLASSVDCSTRLDAAPPMWNVRMVSCVPGSPMDWAAMMPTASPMLTSLPRARSLP